jgi:hypothetical protein
MEAQASLIETLHKACGSVEVAADLLGRAGSLYMRAAEGPDDQVTERFADAARALSLVVEALQIELLETLGPAA